ncbi:MAG: hemolysin family protein [Anaerolineae bacterium]
MDPYSWALAGLLALGVGLTVAVAAAEVGLATVSRSSLREMAEEGYGGARTAEALLSAPERLLATFLAARTIAFALAFAAALVLVWRFGPVSWAGWATAGVAVLLMGAQVLARAWALGRPPMTLLRLVPFVRLLGFILRPITALLEGIGRAAAPSGANTDSLFLTEEGLRFLIQASEQGTEIEEDEKELIASIFAFSDKLVREVMVPRIDVAAVPADAPMLDALDVILKNGHSRIPVYKGSIDNIIGILYAKDLLRYLRDGRTDVPLDRILRNAYFIPESKKVDELLQEMQQRHVHMAVVVDEYGGTAGIVTIEDLLEEIVGEIQDEYDAEQPTVEVVGEGEYLFDARAPLDEVYEHLSIELPEEGGDTLGGFIYSQLGRVPAVGDRVEFGDVVFEVLSVAGRRIKQVRATRRPAAPAPGNESETTDERNSERADDRIGEAIGRPAGRSEGQPGLARA